MHNTQTNARTNLHWPFQWTPFSSHERFSIDLQIVRFRWPKHKWFDLDAIFSFIIYICLNIFFGRHNAIMCWYFVLFCGFAIIFYRLDQFMIVLVCAPAFALTLIAEMKRKINRSAYAIQTFAKRLAHSS